MLGIWLDGWSWLCLIWLILSGRPLLVFASSLIISYLLRSLYMTYDSPYLVEPYGDQTWRGASLWSNEPIFSMADTLGLWILGEVDQMDYDLCKVPKFHYSDQWSPNKVFSIFNWVLPRLSAISLHVHFVCWYFILCFEGCSSRAKARALLACHQNPATLTPSLCRWLLAHRPSLALEREVFCYYCWSILQSLWPVGELTEINDDLALKWKPIQSKWFKLAWKF